MPSTVRIGSDQRPTDRLCRPFYVMGAGGMAVSGFLRSLAGLVQIPVNQLPVTPDAETALIWLDATKGVDADETALVHRLAKSHFKRLIVLVDKIDQTRYEAEQFKLVKEEIEISFAQTGLGILAIIPVVAETGENIDRAAPQMPWYQGPKLLALLIDCDGKQRRAALTTRAAIA